jgi:hypothetical protein
VFCPPDIMTGKSVRADGDFEKGVSGGGIIAGRPKEIPWLRSHAAALPHCVIAY